MLGRKFFQLKTTAFLLTAVIAASSISSCRQAVVADASFSEQTLLHWDAATFPSVEAAARYHWEKHAAYLGKTPAQYTQDALQFYESMKLQARPISLKNGEPGFVIRTSPGGPGGYFTQNGKIISFWYSYSRRRR